MLVLHHFTHPNWFEAAGGWTKEENIACFVHYCAAMHQTFWRICRLLEYVQRTECVCLQCLFFRATFRRIKNGRYFTANRVLTTWARRTIRVRVLIKEKFKDAQVGISLNTAILKPLIFSACCRRHFARWWFMRRAARPFQKCDFWGISYYACVPFDPFPVDMINRPASRSKTAGCRTTKCGCTVPGVWAVCCAGFGKNIGNRSLSRRTVSARTTAGSVYKPCATT
jgi:hypothetical protein